jgi:hypothetical protein
MRGVCIAVLCGAALAASSLSDPRVAECLSYLRKNAPTVDAALSDAYLTENIALALEARDATAFATAVPWPLFLNDVLPYAIMSEPRTAWRAVLRAKVAPMVAALAADATLENATLTIAAQIWDAW